MSGSEHVYQQSALALQAGLFDLRAQSTGLMTSIPEPQGTHKVFDSDEEQEPQALASLAWQQQKIQQTNRSQSAEQRAPLEEALEKDNSVLDAIAEDVAKHTVATPAFQDTKGKRRKASA